MMADETVNEPTLTIMGRGRPKAPYESLPISAWVPTPTYDKLVKMASDRHMTVSSLVKQILVIQTRGFRSN